jgi:hypothetical protein
VLTDLSTSGLSARQVAKLGGGIHRLRLGLCGPTY